METARMEKKLEVIEGTREELEREALEAIFLNPEKLPALQARLKPSDSSQWEVIKNEEA
jgi:hypothetical protein